MEKSKVRNRWKIVPNAITAGNMFCGFLSMIKVMQGEFTAAAWLICLAAVLDALDGKVARLTGAQSKFGIEFDSLSDIVSFGIAPAILVYKIYFHELGTIGVFLSFLFVFAGSTRLARFNIQTTLSKQKKHFNGLPIPAAALTVVSFILFSFRLWGDFTHEKYLIIIVVILSFLMVSSIKYDAVPALSFKKGIKNTIGLVFVILCFILVFFLKGLFLFPACVFLILTGIFRKIFKISGSEEKISELEVKEKFIEN